MKEVTLYRGIAVPQDEGSDLVTRIRRNGIDGSEGQWRFALPDIANVRAQLEVLFAKESLTKSDVFSKTPYNGICACGSTFGAEHYALRHNFVAGEKDQPIVIEFTAPLDDVYVDSRDFLCTAFQLWDRAPQNSNHRQTAILRELFGDAVVRYFEASCGSEEQAYRIGMCNLAAIDPKVVEAHLANNKVIEGRFGTQFCSAFFVKTPIVAGRVGRVYVPQIGKDPQIDVGLDDFFGGE